MTSSASSTPPASLIPDDQGSPRREKRAERAGWWNPDQVYNNLHFLLAQNQASYATHLFVTHPRARAELLEALAEGARAEVFADGISAVYRWLKLQSQDGSLPFSFEQLWHALLPILRSSHQRVAIDAQMQRRQAQRPARKAPDTGVYPQIGSTQSRPAPAAVSPADMLERVRQSSRSARSQAIASNRQTPVAQRPQPAQDQHAASSSHSYASASGLKSPSKEEYPAPKTPAQSRRIRGSQTKYYTGNYPRVERIGPGGAADSSPGTSGAATPGSDAWFREQSGGTMMPQERHPRPSSQRREADAFVRSEPTGKYPNLGSSQAESLYPHRSHPTGQYPSIGSSQEQAPMPHAMGGTPRLISQVPGFQNQPEEPPAPAPRESRARRRSPEPTGQYPQMGGRSPAPQRAPVEEARHRPSRQSSQQKPSPTPQARRTKPQRAPEPAPQEVAPKKAAPKKPSPKAQAAGTSRRKSAGAPEARSPRQKTPSESSRNVDYIGPGRRASRRARRPTGPTTEVPHMGGAAPKGKKSAGRVDRIIPTTSSPNLTALSAQLQITPEKQQLLTPFPFDNTALHWDESRIFNVLSLRILKDPLASELLAHIEDAANTKPLMQALHEAAQIKEPERAIKELHHWFIYSTYEKRLDWPAEHFWTILEGLLRESAQNSSKNQAAREAVSTRISLDNLDSASPAQPIQVPQDLRDTLPQGAPSFQSHGLPSDDDEPLLFDEPVLFAHQDPHKAPEQIFIDILADVDTIEFE